MRDSRVLGVKGLKVKGFMSFRRFRGPGLRGLRFRDRVQDGVVVFD